MSDERAWLRGIVNDAKSDPWTWAVTPDGRNHGTSDGAISKATCMRFYALRLGPWVARKAKRMDDETLASYIGGVAARRLKRRPQKADTQGRRDVDIPKPSKRSSTQL